MAIEFKLPELGENIESADIVKIHVKEGDKVEVDQVVIEIETDKATVEVPSEVSGIVSKVNFSEGDKANVGDTVFLLDYNGAAPAPKAEVKPEPKVEEVKKVVDAPKPVPTKASAGTSSTIEIKLPELGENIEDAQVTKVMVSKGDTISTDQILLEIETDKATVEVPSEHSGVVKDVKIKDGEKAKVGQVVFVLEAVGAAPVKEVVTETVAPKVETAPKQQVTQPVKTDVKKSEPQKLELSKKIVPAAPSVRRFAREIGIDILEVTGKGPGGRISLEDVKIFSKSFHENISKQGGGIGIGIKKEPLPDFSKWGEVKKEKMSNVRKKTAQHLSYAWNVIPHVTQFDKADITDLEKIRKQYSKKTEAAGGKLTVTAILLKVIASALKAFPQFNSSVDMDNQEIILKDYINVGIAVDTEKGLLVPVIKDVDKKNITQLSAELSEISVKARNKKLTIEDMQGGNFTISNLGGIGGTSFTPIINSPEVAIIGVSRGAMEPRFIDGKFEPRLMLPLSLSYDHRVIDGADGARFIRWVAQALEQPFLLSLEG